MLQHLRGQRDDLHVLLLAELARDGAEDTGGAGLALIVDQHHRVLIEPDVGAVLPAGLLHGANQDRLGHVALLHLAGGDRILDGHHHGVADSGIAALAAAQYPDDQRLPGAGVVRDFDDRFLLNHGFLFRRPRGSPLHPYGRALCPPRYFARSMISTTRQRTVLASGRVSMMRTVSPTLAPCSSRAFTVL